MTTDQRDDDAGGTAYPAGETPGTAYLAGEAPAPHGATAARRFRWHAFASGLANTAVWTARGIIVLAGLVILWLVVRALWSIVLPALFALLLASVLWPLNRVFRKILPRVLSALVTLLAFLALVGGIGALILPTIASGVSELTGLARDNLSDLTVFITGPPFNLADTDLTMVFDAALEQARAHTGDIVGGITSGLGTLTSGTIVFLLTLVFTFFCLRDGDRFLPWTSRWTTSDAFGHAARVAERSWQALSSYIMAQAAVALVDAIFIGIGLVVLDIPLAIPLAVLIFFAAFVPVVGAIASGLLATVVAFLAQGWVTALTVLVIVVVVQQLESNFIQPLLVGRTLEIHPAVILASVTAGGTLFGIVGAFLAVPATAVGIVVLRYLRDMSLERRPDPPRQNLAPEPLPE
ncbi:AI-2E family transporter [Arthrobacter sp. Br18]|uniref:AI-2E family transporter n=1 Tax=Arthrobacter sp. Br18 TaxID=1312954 RepID=UPI0004AF2879|nr:AI-2E family transporter [Arthrobacter sp. Br18]